MDSQLSRSARMRARDDRGFTLVESLTAAVILLVVAIGVVTVLQATAGWYAKAAVRTQANAVASQALAEIRSRNFDKLEVVEGADWGAGAIPPTRTVETASTGQFSIETSITSVVDTITSAPMKLITVSVNSLRQPMEAPAVAYAYVSGWTSADGESPRFDVPVTVQCVEDTAEKDVSGDAKVAAGGIRVELRNIDDLSRVEAYAVTDSAGLATFPAVAEGEYWLTSDPNDPLHHPKYFPRRIYPAHGGSVVNPVLAVNHYNLATMTWPKMATLNVGAFRDGGAPRPDRQPVVGLRIYAQAILNPEDETSGYYGASKTKNPDGSTTDRTRYPLPENDPRLLTFSALTNAYGIAVIPVWWTLEPGQQWRVWYSESEPPKTVYSHADPWNVGDVGIDEVPKDLSTGEYLQFQYVVTP